MSKFKKLFVGQFGNAQEAYKEASKTDPDIKKTGGTTESEIESRYDNAKFHRLVDAETVNMKKGSCRHFTVGGAALQREKKNAGLGHKRRIKAFFFYGATR